MHSPKPLSAIKILKTMPKNKTIVLKLLLWYNMIYHLLFLSFLNIYIPMPVIIIPPKTSIK